MKKPSDAIRPTDSWVRRASISAVVFGAANLAGSLFSDGVVALDLLAALTIVVGVLAATASRPAIYGTLGVMGVYSVLLLVVALAVLSDSSSISISVPGWISGEFWAAVIAVAWLWSTATAAMLAIALWGRQPSGE
jgi:hypothetical protein